jgi:wyosine [tRNA(Phe)-imidazoG37] synthetase (radical SAM superfamily)
MPSDESLTAARSTIRIPHSAIGTVYGPVNSWRVGRSLGVDLLCVNSICSFRCVYCQLGRINVHTAERRVYVETARVLAELRASAWREAEIITFSGSGEPTLAANLGDAIRGAKELTGKPTLVLTNSAHLSDARVRSELCEADMVFCKLDAADEETFRRLNRPVAGLTLMSVVAGLRRLRAEFAGRLAVQLMLTPLNARRVEEFACILKRVRPDEVQVNEPLRPVPRAWEVESRGNRAAGEAEGARLKTVPPAEAAEFVETLRRLTGLEVVSRAGTA